MRKIIRFIKYKIIFYFFEKNLEEILKRKLISLGVTNPKVKISVHFGYAKDVHYGSNNLPKRIGIKKIENQNGGIITSFLTLKDFLDLEKSVKLYVNEYR